jgi:sec-independent protein translocase protein TatA
MFKSFGPLEIVLILLVILLIFGARKLPEIGSGLGSAFRGFKDGLTGKDEKSKAEAAQNAAATTPAAPPAPPATPADPKKPA